MARTTRPRPNSWSSIWAVWRKVDSGELFRRGDSSFARLTPNDRCRCSFREATRTRLAALALRSVGIGKEIRCPAGAGAVVLIRRDLRLDKDFNHPESLRELDPPP